MQIDSISYPLIMIFTIRKVTLIIGLFLTIITSLIPTPWALPETTDSSDRSQPILRESSTARILRSKGYIAKDYYIKVERNKLVLNLVRVTNPLINRGRSGLPAKEPVLFIHGQATNANPFVAINRGVEPRDFTSYNVSSLDASDLETLLLDEPSSYSLVFLALNFGHEVWLLNRRSARDTRKANSISSREGLEAANFENTKSSEQTEGNSTRGNPILASIGGFTDYWSFSYDVQAEYDVPETIYFVLKKSKRRKLALVGHSEGGGLILLSLTNYPELAKKVTKAILWAPAMDEPTRVENPLFFLLSTVLPIVSQIRGPVLPKFAISLVEGVINKFCTIELARPICNVLLDFTLGTGSNQFDLDSLVPELEWLDNASWFELSQLVQSIANVHFYDYYNDMLNMESYGQLEAPVYNISKITLEKIFIYTGVTDRVVDPRDSKATIDRMSVDVQYHTVGGPDVPFNHISYFVSLDTNKYLILPNLKVLESNRRL